MSQTKDQIIEQLEKQNDRLTREVLELTAELGGVDDRVEEGTERGHVECARGVLDYLRLLERGTPPADAAGIVSRSHDLDDELVDVMFRFRIPVSVFTPKKRSKK